MKNCLQKAVLISPLWGIMQIWNLEQKFIYFHILQSADSHINIFKCLEVLSVGDIFQNFPNFRTLEECSIDCWQTWWFCATLTIIWVVSSLGVQKLAFALDTLFGDYPLSRIIFLFKDIFTIFKVFFHFFNRIFGFWRVKSGKFYCGDFYRFPPPHFGAF